MNEPFVFLVFSPAKSRLGRTVWSKIEKILRAAEVSYHVEAVPTVERAAERAREWAIHPIRAVVAVGNDQIISGVVNGLLQATQAGGGYLPLGIIPIGKTNDLAEMLGLPVRKPIVATRRLLNGEPYRIDVGAVRLDGVSEERYFANGLGVGFDAYLATMQRRNAGLLSLLNLVRLYKPPTIMLTVDGTRRSQAVSFVSVGNGRRQLGRFWFTPTALIDDGQLDLCLAQALPALKLYNLLLRAMSGSHTEQVDIVMRQATELMFSSENPVSVHLDGMALPSQPQQVEVQILPQRLAVLL